MNARRHIAKLLRTIANRIDPPGEVLFARMLLDNSTITSKTYRRQ